MGKILEQILSSGFGSEPRYREFLPTMPKSPSFGHVLKTYVAPTSSTTAPTSPASPGAAFTNATTISHPTPATTNLYTAARRTVWTCSTTANSATGIRGSLLSVWRGNSARRGGFLMHCRFAQVLNAAASRAFIGLCSLTTTVMVTAEPSAAAASFIGIGFNAADANTNWRAMWKDGTTYGSADLSGAARGSTNNMFDLFIYAYPYDGVIYMSLHDTYNDLVVLPETAYSTNIPTTTAYLGFHFLAGCASSSTAVSLALYRHSLYSPW